jgi:carbon storage regulator
MTLVLSRKKNERIVLPALGVTIVVSRISPDRMQLGIDAPREIAVLREEVFQRERDHLPPPAAVALAAPAAEAEAAGRILL